MWVEVRRIFVHSALLMRSRKIHVVISSAMIYCFWALLKEDNDGEREVQMQLHICFHFIWIAFLCNTRILLRFNWLVFLTLLLLLLLSSYIWFLSLFISVAFRLKFHCCCWFCCCILNLNHFYVGNSLHHTLFQSPFFADSCNEKNVWVSPLLPDAVAAFAITSMCSVTSTAPVVHWHR